VLMLAGIDDPKLDIAASNASSASQTEHVLPCRLVIPGTLRR